MPVTKIPSNDEGTRMCSALDQIFDIFIMSITVQHTITAIFQSINTDNTSARIPETTPLPSSLNALQYRLHRVIWVQCEYHESIFIESAAQKVHSIKAYQRLPLVHFAVEDFVYPIAIPHPCLFASHVHSSPPRSIPHLLLRSVIQISPFAPTCLKERRRLNRSCPCPCMLCHACTNAPTLPSIIYLNFSSTYGT